MLTLAQEEHTKDNVYMTYSMSTQQKSEQLIMFAHVLGLDCKTFMLFINEFASVITEAFSCRTHCQHYHRQWPTV